MKLCRFLAMLLVALCLLGSTSAIAADSSAGGDEAGQHEDAPFLLRVDPGAAIWNLVIFLVVLGVLSKFAWPAILEGLRAREEKIHNDLSEAERINGEAKALMQDYEAKLSDAQSQVQAMLAEARNDAEQTKQQIVDEAKAEADRQRDRAVAEIESAKSTAVSEMAELSSGIALQLAQQVVGRELKEQDHADLIRKSLDNLPSNN